MTSDPVLFDVDGRIAVITLNRPAARNAVNLELARALEAALDRLENDPELWVGILAANTSQQSRPVFSAGADLKEITEGATNFGTERGGFAGLAERQRAKPLIAAVDGLATAGGCEIVLAVDLVVATHRSSFGLAEVSRSLLAGAGGLFRLPLAVGQAVAMDAILTGEPIAADRAYQLGLVSRLAEDGKVMDTAFQLARQIASAAPLAVRESRKIVVQAHGDDDALWGQTREALSTVLASDDAREGVAAFFEGRPPRWTGR